MIETLSFYNYQYRKDMIDKFNISSLEELQLPLHLKVMRRVQLSRSRRLIIRRLRLLYYKTALELLVGRSAGICKVKKHGRVKSGVKINRHHYFYIFFCNILDNRLIFNFINLLMCVSHIYKLRLRFNFMKNLHRNKLCILSKLREKYIIFIPKYRKKKKKSKVRVLFYLRGNLNVSLLKIKRFLLYFFFKRIRLIKPLKIKRTFS